MYVLEEAWEDILLRNRRKSWLLFANSLRFGISLSSSLASGTFHEDIDTFDIPPLLPEEFSVEHVEVWGLGSETDPSAERAKLHVRRPNVQIRSGEADMDDLMDQIM